MNQHPKLSEQELITLLKERSDKGFNYLYDNYAPALYGVILRIVRDKEYADEVIQEVYLKIWRYVTQFDSEKGRLYTWMTNVARNTAIDFIRSKGFQNEQKNEAIPGFVSDSIHFANTDREDYIGLKDILSELKDEWRELIDLAYFKGYTQQEIAQRLNIPIGTVKTRTRNALIELKGLLKDFR